jgi:hypothetical protein
MINSFITGPRYKILKDYRMKGEEFGGKLERFKIYTILSLEQLKKMETWSS